MSSKTYKTGFVLPEGWRIYAIGDVHGCLAELNALHDKISEDLLQSPPERAHIIYLGDYVDRGPHSKEVIDALIERRDRGDGVSKSFLLGNHESGMITFMNKPEAAAASSWLDWGGMETLASYGLRFDSAVLLPSEKELAARSLAEALPPEHASFLLELEAGLDAGSVFFAHAGVDPTQPFDKQDVQDLSFIREPFLSWPHPLEKLVVHGHTKTDGEPEVLPHRVNVDTGCYATGVLTAAVLDADSVRFLSVKGDGAPDYHEEYA